VLQGTFTIMVGDERSTGSAGHAAYVPRGTPHTFRAETDGARLLVALMPAEHERFFAELSRSPDQATSRPDSAEIAEVGRRHGWRVLDEPDPLRE
jgi:hypothetical protein